MRLFSALWPDAATAAALARCRDAWHWSPAARPQSTQRLHLTLHFIGSVERCLLPSFVQRLQALDCQPTMVHLEHVQLWPNGIAALCPASLPEPVETLHAQIGRAVADMGSRVDDRSFRPHVTLARQASGSIAPARIDAVTWRVDRHVLVESDPASGAYRRLWCSAPERDRPAADELACTATVNRRPDI